jgi:hypothetical protein
LKEKEMLEDDIEQENETIKIEDKEENQLNK